MKSAWDEYEREHGQQESAARNAFVAGFAAGERYMLLHLYDTESHIRSVTPEPKPTPNV